MSSVSIKTTTPSKLHTLAYFCELTKTAYTPYVVDVEPVLCSRNGWTSLADLWEELIYETGKDIFADVLHLIKWGTPFEKNGSTAYQKLVLVICEALQSDTPAFFAWTKHYFFKCCIEAITEDHFDISWYPHISNEHYHFLASQATLKIWHYTYGHKKACDDAACYITHYKTRIMKLLPQARHWHPDECTDENNIHNEIFRVYGIDFRCNLAAYRVLHQLLDAPTTIPKRINSPAIDSLIRLDLCSPILISAIWPDENPDIIIKLFLLAEKTARYWFDIFSDEVGDKGGWLPTDARYAYLRKSWLFAYVHQQLDSKKIPHRYVFKVKQAILNVELRS